ncbi:MAG: carbamoyltransferase, partial [Arcticibacterium sp.]
FKYAVGLRMVYDNKWKTLFGFARRDTEVDLEQHHCDLGLAIQEVTEEIVILMAKEAKKLTGSKNLVMAGGVALNCVANGKLKDSSIFENVYIQPAAGDAGGALGAAQAAYHLYFEQERIIDPTKMDAMKGSSLGPEYSDLDVDLMAKKV